MRRPSISSPSNPVASAPVEVGATQTYLEVPAIFCLRVLTGPHSGTVYALTSARVTVGRSAHNDVVLTREPSLSRSHFALNWSADRRTFVVVDFGANAPVLINGEPLASNRPLAPGDLLTIGSTQLVFERTNTSRATRS
jgi:pSer/pThr/pTyr-binding forkhead associated (FHA) protein